MKTLFTITCILATHIIFACEDVILASQPDIDAFPINYPGCTVIEGDLIIVGYDIIDLSPLSDIVEITGILSLENCFQLGSFNGLSSLVSINGIDLRGYLDEFSISGLPSLTYAGELIQILPTFGQDLIITDFSGLANLEHLPDMTFYLAALPNGFMGLESFSGTAGNWHFINVTIVGFNGLEGVTSFETLHFDVCTFPQQFSGLSSVVSIGAIALFGCNFLNFNGLNNLQSVTDNFLVIMTNYLGDDNLSSLEGLESLQSVVGHFYIEGGIFQDCTGLNNLESVGGSIGFMHNNDLLNLSGLESLESAMSGVLLMNNLNLNSLQGLNSLINTGTLWIESCPSLNTLLGLNPNLMITESIKLKFNGLIFCGIEPICEVLLSNNLFVDIIENQSGCNSADEIIETCSYSIVTGNLFADLDCDGMFNNNDVVIPYKPVLNETNTAVAISNNEGVYLDAIMSNFEQTLHVELPGFELSNSVTINSGSEYELFNNQNFALCPSNAYNDLLISLIPSASFRPGFIEFYTVVAENEGNSAQNVHIELDLSLLLSISILDTDGGTLSNQLIFWDVNLDVFETITFVVQFQISVNALAGTPYDALAIIQHSDENVVDNIANNNSDRHEGIIVNSHDPNDITVSTPVIDLDTDDLPARLEYLIRFQNTGTAAAVNVRVECNVDELLSVNSFDFIASSHNCDISIENYPIIEFKFNNIMLADSTSDEPNSHGWISFNLNTSSDLDLMDVIEAQAGIYFDYNDPIITNTATTEITDCGLLSNVAIDATEVCSGDLITSNYAQADFFDVIWLFNDNIVSNSSELIFAPFESGVLEVNSNSTYCSFSASWSIEVFEQEAIVTQNVNELTANEATSYQWYQQGILMEGENNQTLQISESGVYSVLLTFDNGCDAWSEQEFFGVTGISDLNHIDLSVSFFPNPAQNMVYIEFGNFNPNSYFIIFDTMGKRIHEARPDAAIFKLDLNNWPAGLYLLQYNGISSQFVKN